MKKLYVQYLFSKNILVKPDDAGVIGPDEVFGTLFTLARKFGIRIVNGKKLAHPCMLPVAAEYLGEYVPEPFYRGFPDTARQLTPEQLLYDQMLHYFSTYGLGHFDSPEHSVFEENFEWITFEENVEPKIFTIVDEKTANITMVAEIQSMLKSSRPLSESDYAIVRQGWDDFHEGILPENIPCKKTAIQLLYDTKSMLFAKFITITDVIKLVEYIQYSQYGSEDLNKLNLKNQDRKLITRVLDYLFVSEHVYGELKSMFEKRQIWKGLLHHIHYKPRRGASAQIVGMMRDDEVHNISHMNEFEWLMGMGTTVEAAVYLTKSKGTSALIRNLDYILSRCNTDEEVKEVLACLK
jgi:hypothetical protein